MLLWKSFKTFRGLNSHKRSCHFFDIPDLKSLYEVPLQGTANYIEESNEEDEEIDLDKLSENKNINTFVLRLQETIHSYFKDQYDNVGDTQSRELYQRYVSTTESKLKKNLRDLKKSYEINQNDILLLK